MHNNHSNMDTKNNPDLEDSLGYDTWKSGTPNYGFDTIQCINGSGSNLWDRRNNSNNKHVNRNTKNNSSSCHDSLGYNVTTTLTQHCETKIKMT